jgi:Zn-dependent protease/CBS domain-containing protein
MGGPGVMRIVRIGGIDIKIHWSWLIFLLLFTYMAAFGQFPSRVPGETIGFYLTIGVVASILFFVSVLLHELAHSFMAIRRGYKVTDIQLFIFGGVSNIEEEPKKAGDEFLIAFVGPLTSFLLAGIFYGLFFVVSSSAGRVGSGAAAIFWYMALLNLLLVLFNMIPGFPLDGGRVLRSIIWGVTRNFQSSTRIAGSVGQLVAYGFIFWGLLRIFVGGDLGGVWIAFIGWFLLNAARSSVASVRSASVRETLSGITVGQVMEPAPPVIQPTSTLAHLLSSFILPYNLRAVPVADANGQLVGIVTLNDIKDVPQDQWGIATVGQFMTGPDKLRVVTPMDGLDRALQLLTEDEFDQLPVVDPYNRLVGMLTRAHLLRWIQIRDELKVQPGKA